MSPMKAYKVTFWIGKFFKKRWIIVDTDMFSALEEAKRQIDPHPNASWLIESIEPKTLIPHG